ncbi:MAG: glycosyltransferase family 4 protein [Symploca sp. SIO3E6]|nr:glycosyltransferase family 4 protein [Caldora sp. SIO3E6]
MYKAVHLTSVHSAFDTRLYHKECSSLAKAGYEMHLIAPGAIDQVKNGVTLHGVTKINSSRLSRMTKTVWDVYQKAITINAKIYHFHDPELIPVGLLLKAQGKKVIYDVHEDVPKDILDKTWIAKPFRQTVAWIIKKLENFGAEYFDAVVAATPFICDRFSKLNCHAVNVNNYPILSELHLPEIDWLQKERAVCYVGGINDIRGIQEMIEAVGKTDAKLLLAGEFSDVSQYNQAVTMPGWTQVQELGQLNRIEVAQTLAKSMAGLVLFYPKANHINAQPNKMFEYMSAGIPVIASNFPLWQEIVEGNDCGICVDPLNPTMIAEAIQWIIEHPSEAKRMGENGRKAVEKKYNWDEESEILIKLYQDLL